MQQTNQGQNTNISVKKEFLVSVLKTLDFLIGQFEEKNNLNINNVNTGYTYNENSF